MPAPGEAGRFIVKYRAEPVRKSLAGGARALSLRDQRAALEALGVPVHHTLPQVNAIAADLRAEQVEQLEASSDVEYIEHDPLRTPFFPEAVASCQPGTETVPYGIAMVQANQLSDSAIANRIVCIVDSGYDSTHEDLRPRTGAGIGGVDNDGRGHDSGNWFQDAYGHGTHVAGTISATGGNGRGVVGVSGSSRVGLHIVKVFNDAGKWAYGSDLIAAIGQCRAAGANVITMSLGGSAQSTAEQKAFDDALAAGVLSIASAGNRGDTSLSFPASYQAVMSVAAIDASKAHASFSQRNTQVEIAAPGVGVCSTTPGNRYEAWDGTSMAAPHVSGVAALVWSQFPHCSNAHIRSALNLTAEDLGAAGRDASFGHGLVQAKAAADFLAHGCTGPKPKWAASVVIPLPSTTASATEGCSWANWQYVTYGRERRLHCDGKHVVSVFNNLSTQAQPCFTTYVASGYSSDRPVTDCYPSFYRH